MTNRISLLLLALCAVQISFAQVKKQFQDDIYAQTTVVVKEDASSDEDILNGMDLDDFGMHQVIRITTESETPDFLSNTTETAEKETPVVVEATPEAETTTAKAQFVKAAERPNQPTTKMKRWTVRSNTASKNAVAKTTKSADAPKAKTTTSSSYSSKITKRHTGTYGKKTTGKRKNPRFKKSKRKKSKKKGLLKCFSF